MLGKYYLNKSSVSLLAIFHSHILRTIIRDVDKYLNECMFLFIVLLLLAVPRGFTRIKAFLGKWAACIAIQHKKDFSTPTSSS